MGRARSRSRPMSLSFRLSRVGRALARLLVQSTRSGEADEGVGCGTGVPPHKTKWHCARVRALLLFRAFDGRDSWLILLEARKGPELTLHAEPMELGVAGRL